MGDANDAPLLEALLDSWDRNNTILVNLYRALPDDALEVRTSVDGKTVGELFGHMHYVRLVFVEEDAPEHALAVPDEEWWNSTDRDGFARQLGESAAAVRKAVERRVREGRGMDRHYDHPILLLQHMVWHEGYHHGQIKLALKLAGRPLANAIAGPLTWRVWMNKRSASAR